MKKIGITLLLLFFCISVTKAQNLIAVENNSTPAFFTQVTIAVTSANNGDTIYIPGGTWNIGTLIINKNLCIIGAGLNPDSAQANGYTYLNGDIALANGCSNGSLWGVLLQGCIVNNYPNDTVKNYTIRRCRFSGSNGVWFSKFFNHNLIAENIFDYGFSGNSGATNNGFFNNFIITAIGRLIDGNTYKNNVFLSGNFVSPMNYSIFENNIFLSGSYLSSCQNCNFLNNLFVDNTTFPSGTNLGYNNLVNQSQSSIFINQSGTTYSYSQDYHLQSTCPGKNAGSDGTDIGIYGGMFPWKDGSLPPNPHIKQKTIQPSTDINGNLNVNIKVAAQDH